MLVQSEQMIVKKLHFGTGKLTKTKKWNCGAIVTNKKNQTNGKLIGQQQLV